MKQSKKARQASIRNLNLNEDRQRSFWFSFGAITVLLIQYIIYLIK